MEKEIDLETAGRGGRERRCVAACTLVGSIIWLLVAFPIGDTTATTSPSRCLESPPSNIGGRVFVGRVWYELEGRIEPQVFMAGLGCKPPPLSRQDTCSVLTAPDLCPLLLLLLPAVTLLLPKSSARQPLTHRSEVCSTAQLIFNKSSRLAPLSSAHITAFSQWRVCCFDSCSECHCSLRKEPQH